MCFWLSTRTMKLGMLTTCLPTRMWRWRISTRAWWMLLARPYRAQANEDETATTWMRSAPQLAARCSCTVCCAMCTTLQPPSTTNT
jgi:hypothetical protein